MDYQPASTFRRIDRQRLIAVLLVAAFSFSQLTLLRQVGFWQSLELMVFDSQIRMNDQQSSFADRFLLVGIHEEDIQTLGYPINDGDLARALDTLLAGYPAAIGVDLFRDLPAVGRESLKEVVEENSTIVMIEKRLSESVSLPDFQLKAEQRAFADLKLDLDGRVRRGLLMMWDSEGGAHFSLGLQLALKYLKPQDVLMKPDLEDEMGVRLGQGRLQRFRQNDGSYRAVDDGGYQMLMDYGLGNQSLERVSLKEVLEGQVDSQRLAGKVVLLGMVASSTHDTHETPLSAGWSSSDAMEGIVLHAQLTDQILRIASGQTSHIQMLQKSTEWVVGVVVAILGALLGVFMGRLSLQILAFASVLTLLISVSFLAFRWQWWLPGFFWALVFATSFISAGLWMAQRERSEKRIVMQLFGKFASPDVADMLWQQRLEFMDGHRPKPQRVIATVLITDLQGFTTPSSQMEPVQVMEWINRYMEAMTDVAIKHGGFVDDYAGDGLKVDFGVPIARQTKQEIAADASRAVECALEMGELVAQLNHLHPDDPPLRLRAGINTGDLVAGSVGSSRRMKYTTVGDTVNTAARLESFDKESFKREPDADFRLLVSESTKNRVRSQFVTRSLGHHVLKGHDTPTGIYRVLRRNETQLKLLEAV